MTHLRIISHNVFWFQGHPFPGDDPAEPIGGILARLVELYRELTPNVVCLQEIQSREVFQQLTSKMAMGGVYCRGSAYPQYGGAILWKEGTEGHNTSTSPPPFQRFWQLSACPLNDKCVIRICNLHLASSRHLGAEGGSESRVLDMRNLLELEHDPEIIAGDFNEPPGGPVEEVLANDDYVDAAVLTGVLPESTGINKKRSDQIWVHKSIQHRVAGFGIVGFEMLKTDMNGKQLLSDHCPLWLDLDASA